MEKGAVFVIAVLACIASVSSAKDMNTLKAKALYYNKPYSPSYCFGMENIGPLVASVSNDLWKNGKACGRFFKVRCQSASSDYVKEACIRQEGQNPFVFVRVVDNCKDCENGTILLSEEAFESIAHKKVGIIKVAYEIFH